MKRLNWTTLALLASTTAFAGAVAQGPKAGTTPQATPTVSAEDTQALATLNTSCTACHDLSVLTARPHEAAEWPVILKQMIANGANLNDNDFKGLQAYLTRTYSTPSHPG